MISRRKFLKGSGILVVGFSTAGMQSIEVLARAAQGNPVRDYPKFPLDAVDSFVESRVTEGGLRRSVGAVDDWRQVARGSVSRVQALE